VPAIVDPEQAEWTMTEQAIDPASGDGDTHRPWPARPWLLAGLLALAGLAIWAATGGDGPDMKEGWRAALGAFVFFGAGAFAFSLERDRWRGPLAFAGLAGLVMAGLAWRAVGSGDALAGSEYGFLAGLAATGIALPLFQAGFHRTRFATPYARIHRQVWDDAICLAGSIVFLGVSWLLLSLLSELFHLLKIEVLRDLMRQGWFGATFSGAALGAALGTLRNEIGIIGTLRTVVMVVLSILAVPLAAGLALFLGAMVVSGPDVLWEATRSATPVLLACAAGAWVLTNAILREDDGESSGNRALRSAARVLALSILPLTVFAAVSLGTRVAQHGLSPERLWGLVAIAVATACGLAWFVAAVRGWRGGWQENLRRANLNLAVLVSAAALILALPILDFGAIGTRQQVARLERGAVSAEVFDYEALRWEFGDAGRTALAALGRSERPEVARLARLALRDRRTTRMEPRRTDPGLVVVRTADPAVKDRVYRNLATDGYRCAQGCYVIDLGPARGGRRFAILGGTTANVVIIDAEGQFEPDIETDLRAQTTLYRHGDTVEIRTIPRKVIFVNGKPIEVLDPARALEGAPTGR
jgi:hypothetical protein